MRLPNPAVAVIDRESQKFCAAFASKDDAVIWVEQNHLDCVLRPFAGVLVQDGEVEMPKPNIREDCMVPRWLDPLFTPKVRLRLSLVNGTVLSLVAVHDEPPRMDHAILLATVE